ncbi:tRNA (N6-threonylcarbamoyladenosine(37)-N6)-methyltransferase TrmO [Celerinatantimonas sp. MCCC 1A17872]|uniref:tRNA (N6-threonylcarbamoyladenosine(37)-N6)-methyltransferase TrmO n=1 Tax=Celerinatantimonas sp. MCCC 1A17872 TaxID=3177514 RepID=UPI0038C46BE8
MSHLIEPIGYIQSPYKEKFAVPRQPGLVTQAQTRLVLSGDYDSADIVAGLEEFSHVWLIFGFHQNFAAGWQNKIRPPRLGGNKKVGVFASRSTFRPNGMGLSVLPLSTIEYQPSTTLVLSGGDLVDGTPVYDIKPYVGYADAIFDAKSGYAQQAPQAPLHVTWAFKPEIIADERQLIEQVLAQDPRPSYRRAKPDNHHYGVKLLSYNIRFVIENDQCLITELTPL